MSGVLAGLVGGGVAVRAWRRAAGQTLAAPPLLRKNHRGDLLPGSAGIVVPLAALSVRALLAPRPTGDGPAGDRAGAGVLLATVGFAGLGFLDDVAGGPEDRGLRGHLSALAEGRLTTGGVKALGGGLLSLAVARACRDAVPAPAGPLPVDGALVALAANLGNALDLAPGRALKGALLAWLPLAVRAGRGPAGRAAAPVMGAALGLLPDDLGERLILGDCGANAIGAALGATALFALRRRARLALALVLLGLNVAADLTSFSRIIDRVEVLRRLDRLGRPAVGL